MKLKILKSTVCDGQAVKVGQVVDASNRAAATLVGYGMAEAYVEPVKKPGRPKKTEAPVNRMEEVDEGRDAG
jgi:hypothetical protein